jgi:hypothetical protein
MVGSRNAVEPDQQHLFGSPRPEWYVDKPTRRIGRKGLAAARDALRDQTSAKGELARH